MKGFFCDFGISIDNKKGEENPHLSIAYAPNYLLTSCSSAELVTISFGSPKFNLIYHPKSTIFDHITKRNDLIAQINRSNAIQETSFKKRDSLFRSDTSDRKLFEA